MPLAKHPPAPVPTAQRRWRFKLPEGERRLPAAATAVAWLTWLISLWCLFAAVSTFVANDQSISSAWISSDTLYPVHVFTDVFLEGHSLSGWRFSIAPCWFPDLIATWIFMALTGNALIATLLAGFLQVALLAVGVRLLWKMAGLEVHALQDVLVLTVASSLTMHMALHPGSKYPAIYQFFLPQTHVGSLVVVVYALALAIYLMRRDQLDTPASGRMQVFYGALCLLGGMSNLLFLVQMLAPLTIAAGTAVFFSAIRLTALRRALGIGWAAALAGWLLNRTLFHAADLAMQSEMSRDRVLTSIDTFLRGFGMETSSGDFLHLFAITALLLFACAAVWTLRRMVVRGLPEVSVTERSAAILMASLALSGVLSVLAITLGGSNGLAQFKDYRWSMHYLHPAFLLPLFTVPIAIGWLICQSVRRPKYRGIAAASVAGWSLLGILAYSTLIPPAKASIADHQPALVRELDALAAKEGLKTGVAGYWQARLITLLSHSGVRAAAVDPSMNPMLWVSNTEWYQPWNSSSPPDFVVLDDPLFKLDSFAAVQKFGNPLVQTKLGETRVLLYKCRACSVAERPVIQTRPRPPQPIETPLERFEQKITSPLESLTMPAGGQLMVPVTITNPTKQTWASAGTKLVTVSYKFYSGDKMLPIEGERTYLPMPIAPGESLPVEVRVVGPSQPGEYRIRITQVQENVAWFMVRSNTYLELPVTVR